jgi:hypothetical protein
MDELLRIFLTWQFILYSLSIAGATFIVRRLLEFFVLNNPQLPGNSSSRVWRGIILPFFPLILGTIGGVVVNSFPYPEGLGGSHVGRAMFGMVAGLFSGLLFRVINELLRMKTTSQINYLNNNPNYEVIKNTINNLTEDHDPSKLTEDANTIAHYNHTDSSASTVTVTHENKNNDLSTKDGKAEVQIKIN